MAESRAREAGGRPADAHFARTASNVCKAISRAALAGRRRLPAWTYQPTFWKRQIGTAGGTLAWTADSRGFYYTRYPRAGERPAQDMDFYTQLWFHSLRMPSTQDAYQSGRDYPKIAEIQASVSLDGQWVLANVQNGDGGEFIQDIKGPDRKWTRLTKWDDRIVEAKFGFEYPHWHRLSDVPANCSAEPMTQVAKVLSVWLQRVK